MIGVLIVDDSAVVRANLARVLEADPAIRVVGAVRNGSEALAFVARQRPDVITMDIQMPDMDGFEVARRIMESTPVPIIVVSALWDPAGQAMTFKALEAGALVCMGKPPGIGAPDYEAAATELVATVKQMSEVRVVRRWPKRRTAPAAGVPSFLPAKPRIHLVALAASTGGPPAIEQFLGQLPADFPAPVLLVQHIARGFVHGLAEWLNASSALPVALAANHETMRKGYVYVAPDNFQMGVADGGKIVLSSAPPEHYLRPSASYLFRSVAKVYGPSAAGVLLTGMGADGAAELKAIRDAGGVTFAQDKDSSVVHGMPGEAIRLGAVDFVLPPAAIAKALVEMVRKQQTARNA